MESPELFLVLMWEDVVVEPSEGEVVDEETGDVITPAKEAVIENRCTGGKMVRDKGVAAAALANEEDTDVYEIELDEGRTGVKLHKLRIREQRETVQKEVVTSEREDGTAVASTEV